MSVHFIVHLNTHLDSRGLYREGSIQSPSKNRCLGERGKVLRRAQKGARNRLEAQEGAGNRLGAPSGDGAGAGTPTLNRAVPPPRPATMPIRRAESSDQP